MLLDKDNLFAMMTTESVTNRLVLVSGLDTGWGVNEHRGSRNFPRGDSAN